jgi:Carboxypeptidase regulatory-like domain
LSILSEGSFVASTSANPIEILLGSQGGALQGIVRDSASQPVANATVAIVPDFARRLNSFLYKRAITNAAGTFSVRGLAPGDYHVFAWPSPPPPGAEEDGDFMIPFAGRGASMHVNSGTSTEIQLQVIR